MKKVLVFGSLALILFSCKENASTTESASTSPAAMSLPVGYSSSFKMGNPDYAAMIVKGSWKDWQDNKMDSMKTWMADTIVAYESDNKIIKGVDSVMADWKRGRAKYTAVKDTIDAVTSVYSTDKNENWVLVWATEINTNTKGITDTTPVMETWRINKDGKADMLLQFDRHTRKK